MTKIKATTDEATYDDYHFSPTEDLILEILTARYRLGNSSWMIPTRNMKALLQLRNFELIDFKSASVEKYEFVWLTPKGKKLLFSKKYNPIMPFKELKAHQKKLRREAKNVQV